MLLPSVALQDTQLLVALEVLFLHLELFVHHLQLGGVGQRVDVCAVLVRLPCKHCRGREGGGRGREGEGGGREGGGRGREGEGGGREGGDTW